MKIVRATSFFYPVMGGMESHLYNESKELVKLGHDVTVFTSDANRVGKIPIKKEVMDGVKIVRFPTWFKISYFTPFFPRLFWAALTYDYDIMHSNSYRQTHNFCVLIAKLRGKKAVLGIHWPEYPKYLRGLAMNLIIPIFDHTLGPIILKSADALVAQTEGEAKWLVDKFGVKRDKIHIILPGFEKEFFKKRSGERFRKENKIKGQMVLFVGRLHKSKGVDKLIRIADKFKDTTFVIVGDGDHELELKNLAKSLDAKNVLFVGRRVGEPKMEAYAACDVFCHPTDYDAFGITLIEAMSQGKPVIGSNIGGVPYVIGDRGLIFEKDDLDELEKKLRKLLNDKKLCEEFGKKGLKYVEKLTWENIAKQVDQLYKKL